LLVGKLVLLLVGAIETVVIVVVAGVLIEVIVLGEDCRVVVLLFLRPY